MSTPPGATTARAPVKSDNIFTRKIGPLPMWAWTGIIAAVIVAWAWWKNRSQPAASTSSTANASQVPEFVNQTYTTVNPPGAPGMPPPVPGAGMVAVPNVVGMTDTAGDAAIKAAGLVVSDTNERKGGGGGSRKITAQSPAAGTVVPRGSAVSVTVGGQGGRGDNNAKQPVLRRTKTPVKPAGSPRAA